MKLRSSVFGWKSVWMDLAEELQGEFIDGTYVVKTKLPVANKPWNVTMTMHAHPIGKSISETTVIALAYSPTQEFKFALRNSSPIEEVAKLFGLRDILVGHSEFDRAFIIQGNDEALVKELFACSDVRAKIQSQKSVNLSVVDHQHKLFGMAPPKGVNVLTLAEKGAINSFDRLTSLMDLMVSVVDRLTHLEVAAHEKVLFES